jgi:ATP-dependent Zn protease
LAQPEALVTADGDEMEIKREHHAIDTAVRELIDAAFKKAAEILCANRPLLDQTAKELLIKETFSAEEPRKVAAGSAPAPLPLPEGAAGIGVGVAAAAVRIR